MYLGKKVRLERIINRENGRTIIVPMDHGVTIGAVDGLMDMREAVNDMARGGAVAVLIHQGTCELLAPHVLARTAAL